MGNENLILLQFFFFLLPKGVEQQHFGIENCFYKPFKSETNWQVCFVCLNVNIKQTI